MGRTRIPAVFMRGGTSKGLFFHRGDLPERTRWDQIFLAAIGSPDPNMRQLDGMGGGISSLSKIVVIGPPTRSDADVDYIFGQVAVDEPVVDYDGPCGNLASAVGPFAVDEGLVTVGTAEAAVRIHDVNTGKIVVSRFAVVGGNVEEEGTLGLPGVAGKAAPIRLEFLDPGGSKTGRLLPTGHATDMLDVAGTGRVKASLIDSTTACVFVNAADFDCTGAELPETLELNAPLLQRLQAVRCAATTAMGLVQMRSTPKIAMVAPSASAPTLDGTTLAAVEADILVRTISMGRPHRAVPLTVALCLAVAAQIEGTVVHAACHNNRPQSGELRLGTPSGPVAVEATVRNEAGWCAERAVAYRTARRLMEGAVLVPDGRLANPAGE